MMRSLIARLALVAVLLGGMVPAMRGQTNPFVWKNSFGVFGEYSNDSSHIALGNAENRKLLNFGLSYTRSLVAGRGVNFQYLAELRPVILESDPLGHEFDTYSNSFNGGTPVTTTNPEVTFAALPRCSPFENTYTSTVHGPNGTYVYTDTYTITCGGRKWTFGEGMSPVGLQLNMRTRHRLQPVLTGMGGYMFSTEPLPCSECGSFNFTFEFGAGFELYRSRERSTSWMGNRSIRAEYRFHHISNHDTTDVNAGIDSGMLHVTYAFGR